MDNEFYSGIEEIFKNIIDFLNKFNKSEILQDGMYKLFEANVYGNLIKNIFSNLNEENSFLCDFSKEDVENFKLEFINVLDDAKKSLSIESSLEINAIYYNKFKQNVNDKFPTIYDFINKLELEFDLDKLDNYMIEKKILIKNTGKNESDIEVVIGTRILEEDIQNSGGLSPDLNLSKDFSSKLVHEFLQKSMKITEWNIWHSYSTFLIEDNYKLEDIAYKLVESDLCPLVFSQNLKIWWKENGQVNEDNLKILEYTNSGVQFQFPKISNNYVLEGLVQFIDMWNAESNLLNEKYLNSFEYIRCFMNPCRFKSGERPVLLYPQIKFYNNGVINLEFRQLSPFFEYLIDSFIMHEVNLYKNEIDEIETSPEIMKLSGRFSFFNEYPLLSRFKNLILTNMDEDIERNTEYIEDGDFSFYYTKVIKEENEKFNLDDLFVWFTSAIAYVINSDKKGDISFFRKLKYNYGNYWTLRPSVYITEFNNQPYQSSKIHEDFGKDLGKIMARTYQPFYMDYNKFLGKNLREFGDYCLYLNRGLTLWVFSKSGASYDKKKDPNLSLTYEKQVQVEFIDHLNISLKRMSEISSNLSLSYESVLTNQLNLDNLEEFFMEGISSFGEIDNILRYASKELNWDNLRELIKNKLLIRSQYTILKRDEFFKKLAIIFTIMFGLIGAYTFFSSIINYILSIKLFL